MNLESVRCSEISEMSIERQEKEPKKNCIQKTFECLAQCFKTCCDDRHRFHGIDLQDPNQRMNFTLLAIIPSPYVPW